jgi:uncharacterized Zn finger protein (UPF0148 family)
MGRNIPERKAVMTKSFKCPSCGAPLDYDGGEKLTVQCPFCSNVVIVPEELRPERPSSTTTPVPAPINPPVPDDPEAIRARIKENRQQARAERRELRHQLRRSRRQHG